jgi:hypothetical protein
MKTAEIKRRIDAVASDLKMQGFVLTHEFAFKNKSKLDVSVLYTTTQKLNDLIGELVSTIKELESKEKVR